MITYLITNKINGKQYVGQTKRSLTARFIGHCEKGSALHSAIQKYGKASFDLRELGTYDSLEDLNNAEQYFIDYFNCITPNGYNLTSGGEGGYIRTQETKDKISKAKLGISNPKVSEALKGKHNSPKTEFKKGHISKHNLSYPGDKNPMYGKVGAMKGRTHSSESRAKISAAKRLYWENKRNTLCILT